MAFSLTKEHLAQVVSVGVVVVGTAVWIVNAINGVGQASRDAMNLMDRRVTTLEVQQKGESQAIDRLSISVDQERAALTDLALSIKQFQQMLDDTRARR